MRIIPNFSIFLMTIERFNRYIYIKKDNGISSRQDSYKPDNCKKRAKYTAWP